jgi:chitinase
MFLLKPAPWTRLCICLLSFFAIITAKADLWRTGYYPGYATAMPPSEIDFSALSHIVHFSVLPNGDGSLNTATNNITPLGTAALVTAAHNANVKVLICIGGAGSYFPNAAGPNLSNFIYNLTNFMAAGNYDGIDVDWEPLNDSDTNTYVSFISGLRAALNRFSTHKLLATAVPPSTTPAAVATVAADFDPINLMTYDYSGPYEGWVTWFNSPLYNGGYTFPSNPGEYVPSTDVTLTNFLTAGIPAAKLGIGLPFYGYVWGGGNDGAGNGMSYPRESWEIAPTNFYTVTYNQIVSSNFPAGDFNYDTVAQAAWIGLSGHGTNNMFIAYDSPRACEAKISYARNHGIGGVIIWELSQDHISGQPDPLLEAVKQAMATPGSITAKRSGSSVNLGFGSMPLGNYSVQWSSGVKSSWNTLVLTNAGLTSTGGVIQVSDSLNQPARFYRVQTPP